MCKRGSLKLWLRLNGLDGKIELLASSFVSVRPFSPWLRGSGAGETTFAKIFVSRTLAQALASEFGLEST